MRSCEHGNKSLLHIGIAVEDCHPDRKVPATFGGSCYLIAHLRGVAVAEITQRLFCLAPRIQPPGPSQITIAIRILRAVEFQKPCARIFGGLFVGRRDDTCRDMNGSQRKILKRKCRVALIRKKHRTRTGIFRSFDAVAVAAGEQKITPVESLVCILRIRFVLLMLDIRYVQRAFAVRAVVPNLSDERVAGIPPMGENLAGVTFLDRAQLSAIPCRHQKALLQKVSVSPIRRVVVIGKRQLIKFPLQSLHDFCVGVLFVLK